MRHRTTGNSYQKTIGTEQACEYTGVGKNSLYKYFDRAKIKIGSRTLWDTLIIDQILDAKRQERITS